jgi:hypothetical protein
MENTKLLSEQENGTEFKNHWIIREYKSKKNSVRYWDNLKNPGNYWVRNNYKKIY